MEPTDFSVSSVYSGLKDKAILMIHLRARLKFPATGLLLLFLGLFAGCRGSAPNRYLSRLPELSIPLPATIAERQYLGLTTKFGHFSLADIKAKVVVLEMILVQCPHCQHEAPQMNRFYELVKEHGLLPQIKFLSIAMGNTPLEVGLYRERYQVPFPIIPNPGRYILTVDATPTLYLLRPQPNGESQILFAAVGRLPKPAALLQKAIAWEKEIGKPNAR